MKSQLQLENERMKRAINRQREEIASLKFGKEHWYKQYEAIQRVQIKLVVAWVASAIGLIIGSVISVVIW